MSKQYKTSLFIFRRDLRIQDNLSLLEAISNSQKVLPLFVFNDHQIDPEKNEYFSSCAFSFMLESLDDLADQLNKQGGTLFFAKGKLEKVLKQAHTEHGVQAVYVGEDYTPFSKKRDEHIRFVCDELNIEFHQVHDLILNNPRDIETGGGTPYKVFTPFRNTSQMISVQEPTDVDGETIWQTTSSFETGYTGMVEKPKHDIPFSGGRTHALSQMAHIKNLKNYKEDRDFPWKEGTTKLSPHIKFGTLSVREVYHYVKEKYGPAHGIINELYWRDFYAHLAFHFPHVFGNAFKKKYAAVEWENNKEWFSAWCEGKTGFPIIDAGMRQLNETGWMHNRVRMIVASFLTKDLHIDWRWGEKYFAQKLVDYDPATNNGSWQWAASTGADAQPYFRIFNPWRQQERFDKECEYIKKWIPELRELTPKEIHKLADTPLLIPDGYHRAIIDHKSQSQKAKEMFSKIK